MDNKTVSVIKVDLPKREKNESVTEIYEYCPYRLHKEGTTQVSKTHETEKCSTTLKDKMEVSGS